MPDNLSQWFADRFSTEFVDFSDPAQRVPLDKIGLNQSEKILFMQSLMIPVTEKTYEGKTQEQIQADPNITYLFYFNVAVVPNEQILKALYTALGEK